MRKLLTGIIVLVGLSVHAQYASQENRFEHSNAGTKSQLSEEANKTNDSETGFPGNPPIDGTNPGEEKAPIDDYIPILLFTGILLIILNQRKKVKTN